MVGVTDAGVHVAGTMHQQNEPRGYGLKQGYSGHKSAKETAPMTETHDAVISEALSVIDKALAQMLRRELVSVGEVTDVLLDVRTLLTLPVSATPDI